MSARLETIGATLLLSVPIPLVRSNVNAAPDLSDSPISSETDDLAQTPTSAEQILTTVTDMLTVSTPMVFFKIKFIKSLRIFLHFEPYLFIHTLKNHIILRQKLFFNLRWFRMRVQTRILWLWNFLQKEQKIYDYQTSNFNWPTWTGRCCKSPGSPN